MNDEPDRRNADPSRNLEADKAGDVSSQPSTPSDSGTPRSGSDQASTRLIERHLLEFLVCPIKKTTLIYDRERQELISPVAGCAFPIQDGVPLLVESCARELTDHDRWLHRLK